MHNRKINIKNQVNYYYENLIKPIKIETRNIFFDKKSNEDLEIYLTRYHPGKLITMLILYYNELIGKIEE